MSYKLSDILIKPDSKEEKLYCKKYNIGLERLKNGITILGMPCKKDFTSSAQIHFDFQEGAYGNPSGTVHFLEHFINQKARRIAQRNSVDIRARTSQIDIAEEIGGVANPKVTDYGLWTVLEEVRRAIEQPLNTVPDPLKTIESERNVIRAEIRKRDSNPDFQSEKHFKEVVLSTKNPMRDMVSTAGTETDLEKIDLSILKKIQKKVLVGKNLLISFYTEGDLQIQKTLTKVLEGLFTDFPAGEKNNLDLKLLEEINPDLKLGNTYSYDHGIKNGIVTTEFVWVFKDQFPSEKYFSLILLRQALTTELFLHSRKMGWGYVTSVNLTRPTNNLNIVRLRIDSRKDNQKEFKGGVEDILKSVKNITTSLVEIEKKKQKATDVNAMERLSWIVNGFKDYGAMIDADKIRSLMLAVKSEDLNKVLDEMLSTEPVVIVTGDLN